MHKHYKKFYEIGANRYYTIQADGDMYIATETFIEVARKYKFLKSNKLTQGLKLLKVSVPILTLLNLVSNCVLNETQKEGTPNELQTYEVIPYDTVKKEVFGFYKEAQKQKKDMIKKYYRDAQKSLDKNRVDIADRLDTLDLMFERDLKIVEESNPLKINISLKRPVGVRVVNDILQEGYNFLYSEKVTALASNVFLYRQDTFGTLTIFKLFIIKDTVKSIDTYIYDIPLLQEFMDSLIDKETKKKGGI